MNDIHPRSRKLVSALTMAYYTADVLEHVCAVERVLGPAEAAGWTVIRGVELENKEIRIFPERAAEADLVLIQRDFPRYGEGYREVVDQARASGKPVIFEIDDLLTELPEVHPDVERYQPTRGAVLTAIAQADAVICTTNPLAAYLRQFNPRVWVAPNYLNDRLWTLRPIPPSPVDRTPLVIGYLGAHSHIPDLASIAPALERVLDHFDDQVLLRIWGIWAPPGLLERPNVEWLFPGLVDYAQFAAYFLQQESDIFIAPLLDHPFNQCKSSLKYLECSALGVPGVFSRVTPYANVVQHGDNGFLAASLDEWDDCLTQLIETPALRQKMGAAAQETIRQNWMLSDHVKQWTGTWQEILAVVPVPQKPEIERRLVEKFYAWNRADSGRIDGLEAKVTALNAQAADLQALIAAKDQTLAAKDRENQALTDRLNHVSEQLASTSQVLTAITTSTGWRMLEGVYRVRLVLIPRGSHRERWLHAGVRAAFHLKQHGLRSFLQRATTTLKQDGLQAVNQGPAAPPPTILDGEPCPAPAISVVIPKNGSGPQLEESAVQAWVERQTLRSVEVVLWDLPAETAHTLGGAQKLVSAENSWSAPDVQALCQGITGRYLCMASSDLLEQNSSYLEANLLALETEALLFTVNSLDRSGWAVQNLSLNRLPGSADLPLLRMVVRKDCLTDEFSIDITSWAAQRARVPAAIGKLIVHTTTRTEKSQTLPVETLLKGVEVTQQGALIVGRALVEDGIDLPLLWEPVAQIVHPVDTVLPAMPEPSNLPTVIVFMQFLAVGGAERLALELIRFLQDRVRFVVVTVEGMDTALGTTADAFHQTLPYVYTVADYLHPALYFSLMSYLIERFQADTFYIANGSNWIYDNLSKLRQRYPQLRIANQVYDHQFGWINRYDPAIVNSIDAHIGANPNINQAYLEHGAAQSQIHFVEHAINMDEVNPADYPLARCLQIKQKLELPVEKKLVTFCARLHPQKRPLDFIELARRFANEEEVHFLMVGDGSLAPVIEEQVARIGLKNLTRCKFYTPIADIYAITDVMVLPSEYEAMPLVVLETLAMGKPVVATDVGHIRDVVEMARGGVVVPNIGDVAALRMGVLKALHEPVEADTMRQAIDRRFGVSHIAQQYLQVWLGDTHA